MEVYVLMWVVLYTIKEKRKLTKMLLKKNYEKLAFFPNITIYNGQAQFINSSQIEVKNANDTFIISA